MDIGENRFVSQFNCLFVFGGNQLQLFDRNYNRLLNFALQVYIMKVLPYYFIAFLGICWLTTCTDEPNFPVEPKLDLVRIGKTVLKQGRSIEEGGDTTMVTVYFEDGDGDIGGDSSITIYRIDTRSGFTEPIYRVVEIPLEGVSSSISGEIDFALPPTCCNYIGDNTPIPCEVYPPVPEQEVIFEIYIKDRAGNQSNTIALPPLTLLCQ